MDGILGDATPMLVSSMRYRMARQAVLAGNIVNADTPGFRTRDIRFDALLDDAGQKLLRTHSRHLPNASSGGEAYRTELGPEASRPDGNGVDLDRELVRMSRNAGAFGDQAAVLSRLLNMTRAAITGQP